MWFCSGKCTNQNFEMNFWDDLLLRLPFFPCLIVLPLLFTYFWACFQFHNFRECIIKAANSYHRVAKCSQSVSQSGKFFSKIFTQIPNHFYASFTLSWPYHSDLGIMHWKDLVLLQNLIINISIISELNKEFPAIWLVERYIWRYINRLGKPLQAVYITFSRPGYWARHLCHLGK